MSAYVVDVNVPIVANGHSEQASLKCQLSCIKFLEEIQNGIISIDSGDYIFSSYRSYLSLSGQPGVGDEFMYWLHQNLFNEKICEQVSVRSNDSRGFDEFPDDHSLDAFDRADRIYVAVALSSSLRPQIVNAVDSDWSQFQRALSGQGVRVRQLCPECNQG